MNKSSLKLKSLIFGICFLSLLISSLTVKGDIHKTRGKNSGYREDKNGWIFISIKGSPKKRGKQYGSLIADEIDEFIKVLKLYLPQQETAKSWDDYREAAEEVLYPNIDKEYIKEFEGIVQGLEDSGYDYDIYDIIVVNGFMELSDYYFPSVENIPNYKPMMRCSAFIATGDWTRDGKIVMAHNSWDDYIIGQRCKIVMDMKPSRGNRILMQCWPGFIHSGTDFYVTSAGLMITETTIGFFSGYDTSGIPEFVRIRKAAQYAKTIDDFYQTMITGNNGGYANSWLVGDINTNEIAKLELGLTNTALYRSKNGFFDGENYVDNSKMIREECGPTLWKCTSEWPDSLTDDNCVTARRMRWFALMSEYKGNVDADLAKEFLADQYEQVLGEINPGGKVLMCRMEITDIPEIQGAAAPRPFGACDGKVTTADLVEDMSFWVRIGHPDGSEYTWTEFLQKYPDYAWQEPYLNPLVSNPWTEFSIRE